MLRYDVDAEARPGQRRQPRRPLTRQSDFASAHRPRDQSDDCQATARNRSPSSEVSLASHKASNVPQAKFHRLTTPTGDEAGDSRVGPRHSCVMKAGALLGVTGPASEGDVAFCSWTDAAMSEHGVISISRQSPAGIVFACCRQSTETSSERIDTLDVIISALGFPVFAHKQDIRRPAGRVSQLPLHVAFSRRRGSSRTYDLSRLHCGNRPEYRGTSAEKRD